MHWLNEIGRALQMAAMMGWQMLWALLLGFGLSALVQATVSREKVARLMPDGSPALDCGCLRPGRGFLVVFLCGGCDCAHALPQRGGLSRGHGLRIRID